MRIPVLLSLTTAVIGFVGGFAVGRPDAPPQAAPAARYRAPEAQHALAPPMVLSPAIDDALRALEESHRPVGDFWRLDKQARLQRIENILTAEQQARSVLVAELGPQISDSSVYWRLFRPMHERMPALASDDQVALHELEQRFFARALMHRESVSFDDHLQRVRLRLGTEIANDYALLASPEADQLRHADLQLSEHAFRRAFAALNALSRSTNPGDFSAARRELREQLGSRGFARFWSQRDPNFQQITLAARRFDLSDETVLSAYSVLLENQDAMLAAAGNSSEHVPQEILIEEYRSGRRRLSAVVGDAAADVLMQAAAREPEAAL